MKMKCERESGIELLKIFSIIMIVITHTVNTLSVENTFISYNEYQINLSMATVNIQYFALVLLRYVGIIGNNIFFICSAWFLMDSNRFKKGKWICIWLDVWTLSICVLLISFYLLRGNIAQILLLKSLFPNIFANNWYITCYLLFYPLHPILNTFIRSMTQKGLFRLTLSLFIIYICFNFIITNSFFYTHLMLFITVYFVIAYLKYYLPELCVNIKKNYIMLIIGVLGFVGIIVITNVLGLAIPRLSGKLFHWDTICNPFAVIIAISSFNIFRKFNFKNIILNYFSSMSLFVYVIHENIILRTYCRPYIFNYIYHKWGYSRLWLWVLLFAFFICCFSFICSTIYKNTLHILVMRISQVIYGILRKEYNKLENFFISLH